jgi:hypothetical protein
LTARAEANPGSAREATPPGSHFFFVEGVFFPPFAFYTKDGF